MPHPSYSRDDRYLKRLAIAGGVAAAALIVGTLLGPSTETVERWILDRHIGAEGPTKILPNLDVIPDDAPTNQDPLEHMSSATQGMQVEEELSTPVPDAEKKRPETADDRGQQGFAPLRLLDSQRPTPRLSDEQRPEMHTLSQTSEDFVLELYVEPGYPTDAHEASRAKIIEVDVALYVDSSGLVSEAYIRSSNGGRVFDEAVLEAVRSWRYRPIVPQPEGFWSSIRFRFDFEELTPRVEMQAGR